MQHYNVLQEQQTCVLQKDMQQFIIEISTLRSLAEEAGIAGHLLEELDGFKYKVEHLDSSVWERKEVRVLNRDELVRLSLAVLEHSVHGPVEIMIGFMQQELMLRGELT